MIFTNSLSAVMASSPQSAASLSAAHIGGIWKAEVDVQIGGATTAWVSRNDLYLVSQLIFRQLKA